MGGVTSSRGTQNLGENSLIFTSSAHADSLCRYVESSLLNRWSPWAWIDWLGGRPLPGDGKDQFKPEGFRAYEIGPSRWADKGFNECDRDVESIKIKFEAGCPMAFSKPEFE